MHVNKNFCRFVPKVQFNSDGTVKGLRRVDQFFTLNINKSKFGWHTSEIDLLDKASKLSDNGARYTALLNHLKLLMTKEPDNGRSVQELFDGLKPAYLQTPSEVTAFIEQNMALFEENRTTTDEPVSENTEPSASEPKSE